MNPLVLVALTFVIVAGVTVLAGVLLLRWWPALERGRLSAPVPEGRPGSILRWEEDVQAGWRQAAERLGRSLGGSTGLVSRYRQRLVWAGYHNPRAVLVLLGAKVGLALLGGLGHFLYGLLIQRPVSTLIALSLLLAVAGFFTPDYWLSNRIKARQRKVVSALPEVLDLLMVCVEAGMSFDSAVARVAQQPEGRLSPLHQEMLRMHLEGRAGRPRQEALRAMGERTGVEAVKSMVGAFIQTEKLGTPLGKALRVHADQTRLLRQHRAEERAQMAPLKMLLPTVVFLLPSFFLVTMAPSVLGLVKLLQTLGK